MWTGATNGFAGLKFSTSPKMLGQFDTIIIIMRVITIVGIESFTENIGWNLILSKLVCDVVGFEEPFSCNIIKWMIITAKIAMGVIKCNEKNRFSVGCETEGPPQIHVIISLPMTGIADNTPVITVAPQNDICPQGKT